MSQQVLEKLFDSPVKLRLLKLFLRNPNDRFSSSEIRRRTMLESNAIRRQLQKLHDIRFISATKKRGSADRVFGLNTDFIFFEELQNLILKSSPADEDKITKKIKSLGKIRLAILSGIFLKPERENTPADLLIVADAISEKKLNNFIRNLEAEAGAELHYAILSADEFSYRYKMFDRFLRDIFEKPHKVLIGHIAPR